MTIDEKPASQDEIREAQTAYNAKKQQGEYTIEDYYALPDDKRMELIDGVFYDMAAPSNIHQIIAAQIYRYIFDFIYSQSGRCVPLIAPADVNLGKDDKTMVQPDVMVVCDRNKIQRQKINGAPDMVVEIISESTRMKDSSVKLMKYKEAGVREYWLVDPDKKLVVVYEFEHEKYPVIYGFDDEVFVGIFGSECRVNFPAIYEQIEFLYDAPLY